VKRVSCEPGGDALHVIPRMAEEKLAMIAALTAQFVPRHQPTAAEDTESRDDRRPLTSPAHRPNAPRLSSGLELPAPTAPM
jgi:hypothetical protein